MKVIIAALGEGGLDAVSLGAYKAMKENFVVFRTARDEAVQALVHEGVKSVALDEIYETAEDFDELAAAVAQRVVLEVRSRGTVVYAVPGGAGIGDATVGAVISLCKSEGVEVAFAGGTSPVENAALFAGGLLSAVICSAYDFESSAVNTKMPLIITEVDNEMLAGELKVKLMEHYPEEFAVLMIDGENAAEIALKELDWQKNYSHKCKIVLKSIDFLALSRYDFTRLCDLVAVLRGQGDERFEPCPWDVEQTHASLRQDMIEEAYEFADAVDSGDVDRMADELGDVLLQVVMHSQIASEYDEFSAADVISGICNKMISRHQHVFGDKKAGDAAAVLRLWDDMKRVEKRIDTVAGTMKDVPRAYPALMRSSKVLKRAANVGFDWPDIDACMDKITEEMREVQAEIKAGDKERIEEEIGDMLLAAAKIPRVLGIDGEHALNKAVDKYIARFEAMEQMVLESGRNMRDISLEELNVLWNEAKKR